MRDSDQRLVSPYNIFTWSNVQVIRIRRMIISDLWGAVRRVWISVLYSPPRAKPGFQVIWSQTIARWQQLLTCLIVYDRKELCVFHMTDRKGSRTIADESDIFSLHVFEQRNCPEMNYYRISNSRTDISESSQRFSHGTNHSEKCVLDKWEWKVRYPKTVSDGDFSFDEGLDNFFSAIICFRSQKK